MRGVEDVVAHVLLAVRFRETIERSVFLGLFRHLDAFGEDIAVEGICQGMQYVGRKLYY